MSRNIFGWSYPPGAANDPNAPWNQEEVPDNESLKEAFSHYTSLCDLYSQTYRATSCGPTIGARIFYYGDEGEEVTEDVYCSDLRKWSWEYLDSMGAIVTHLIVSSIVEGVEQTTMTHKVCCDCFQYDPEDIRKMFWEAVDAVNKEASEIWNQSHGCERCHDHWVSVGVDFNDHTGDCISDCDGLPNFGSVPVYPDCPDCKGQGIII